MSLITLPKGKVSLCASVLLLLGSKAIAAQTITVSGAQTSGLTVSSATAGSQPNAATSTDGSTTYNCNTPKNGGVTFRISAALSGAMPAGTTLRLKLSAPAVGGTSAGFVVLSTTPANVVTGIPQNKVCGQTAIQYQLNATAAAGIISAPGNTRSVTLTIQSQ